MAWMLPPIYKAYMHFVFLTSKRVFYNFDPMKEEYEKGASLLSAIWHQDVMLQPFTFRDFNVVTMVSKSNIGEVMAKVVRRIGFIPVRGGTSMAGSEALTDVIDYVRTHQKIFFGITVDGSRGPRYKVKRGIIVVAKEAGVPIYPVRASAKRRAELKTWDRTLVPIPFNEFVYFCREPVFVPPDADREAVTTMPPNEYPN